MNELYQQIVDPAKIEKELLRIWDGAAKEKVRACLFNLIVYNTLSARTDYIRDIVQKVSEKYPCRVLFITHDPTLNHPSLRTAVSIVGDGAIACDYIDIGVSESEMKRVPFLLLPHIIPDLPVSLLWTENPCKEHPLFDPLIKLASRVIFDSESADNLLPFSQKVEQLKKETAIDIADLNWARTEGWRDLIASLFHSGKRLDQIQEMTITYNAKETEFFCHLKVQSIYLLSWISSRLGWKFEELPQGKGKTFSHLFDRSNDADRDHAHRVRGAVPNGAKDLTFAFEKQKAKIIADNWEKLGPGTILSVDLSTQDGHIYRCKRSEKRYHHVIIQTSSSELCELPYQFVLGQTATGHSLVKEIITKGTSSHYLGMLQELRKIDQDQIC